MNANTYNTTDYEIKSNWTLGENKPNSNPIKPNFQKAKMNINSLITKDYIKKDDFAVRKNKPNSNPISVKAKMNVNLYVIEDYENETTLSPKKTNPNKANFKHGTDALSGDLIVFPHPNLTVTSEFRKKLVNYVASGGKVLILDSPANVKSTANSLLYPFGITVKPSTNLSGPLKAPESWPVIKIDSTCEIEGGEPILSVVNVPVAARIRHGKGTVTVIGFGSRFADTYMGVTGDVIPDDELRKVFDLQFTIFKAIVSEP